MRQSFNRIAFTFACLLYMLLQPSDIHAITERNITPAQWQQLTNDKAFSYRNDKEAVTPESEIKPGILQRMFNAFFEFFGSSAGYFLLWVFVTGLVVYLLYSFAVSRNSFLFGKNKKAMNDTNQSPEEMEDMATTDWEALLQQASGKNDFRLAVRYSYMLLLQTLQKRELINYRNDKTNYDYYTELKATDYRQPFRQLSRQYEYTWYGGFNLSPAAYSEYLAQFNNLKKQLGCMSRVSAYIVMVLLLGCSGCLPGKSKNDFNKWIITLDKNDKGPYGTYLAYQSLKYYFPGAGTEVLSRGFNYSNMGDGMKYNFNGQKLLVLNGLYFYVSDGEWNDLKEFVRSGNELLIFCSSIDKKIEKELGFSKEQAGDEEEYLYPVVPVNANKNVLSIATEPGKHFGYHGRSLKGYFSFAADTTEQSGDSKDSTNKDGESTKYICDTLGYAKGHPDIIRYKIGDGHITIHAAPLSLSNYFLLQEGNTDYLTGIWRLLPGNISHIYWNDYYKRDGRSSGFDVLWRYPATRWALYLAIFALLMYVLFEGKRKQRVIPVIPPLKNESVSFVETVGRLYYNKGNHANLAEKMTMQFLEWVRTHYFLNTNLLNENFVSQLTNKSGQPESTVRGLMEMIHEIRLGSVKTDDAYLYQLYSTIQQFYKNQHI